MVVIVDYKAGNLTSVKRALDYLQVESEITNQRDRLLAADRVIFPGVGAAAEAMGNLRDSGLDNAIRDFIAAGKPFLGICIGYQLLFDRSEENDNTTCLGILSGEVVRFPRDETGGLKIPQMGWNNVKFLYPHPVWDGLPPGSEFYFVHAYYPTPATDKDICATTEYGLEYASGVAKNNVVAFQFHPEKSGRPGLQLLENFCHWTV
ncbi:MAG: imidazole glycerol phosphate synthase subunit HisH [Lentisphaeria bacterium]